MSELMIEITEPVGTVFAEIDPEETGLELHLEPVVIPLTVTNQEYVEISEVGPAGAPGPAGNTYVHNQTTPASTWVIEHNLHSVLSVVLILDSDPTEQVFSDVEYPLDLDTVIITLPEASSGKAYLR